MTQRPPLANLFSLGAKVLMRSLFFGYLFTRSRACALSRSPPQDSSSRLPSVFDSEQNAKSNAGDPGQRLLTILRQLLIVLPFRSRSLRVSPVLRHSLPDALDTRERLGTCTQSAV